MATLGVVGRVTGLLLVLSSLFLRPILAEASAPTAATQEYDLKAAFLFHFARFVDWPADAFSSETAPLVIGVLGTDPFGASLDEVVANEVVHERKLVVRRYASIDQLEPCHILFVSASESGRLDPILARVGRRSVLTVGDTKDFAARSGIIGFEMVRSRLRLQINLEAARASKLTISSQLLRQSKIVRTEARR